jgi:hypothetical protein
VSARMATTTTALTFTPLDLGSTIDKTILGHDS